MLLPVNEPYRLVDIDAPYPDLWVQLVSDMPMQMASQGKSEITHTFLASFKALNNVQGTLGSAGKLAMLVPLILQLVLKGAMKKLWFFFNTVQLASTFTEFNLVKSPANVTLIKKAYDKIVNLKILPDGFIDQLIANVGINKKIEKPRDDVIDLTEFK